MQIKIKNYFEKDLKWTDLKIRKMRYVNMAH